MKNIFLLLIVLSIFVSCSKDDIKSCKDVEYDEFFTIKPDNQYCFPDGDFIKVVELVNNFCPCDSYCFWEGEMNLHYVVKIDGVEYSGKLGSSPKTDNTIESKWELEYKDLNSDVDCGGEITSVKIRVTEL